MAKKLAKLYKLPVYLGTSSFKLYRFRLIIKEIGVPTTTYYALEMRKELKKNVRVEE